MSSGTTSGRDRPGRGGWPTIFLGGALSAVILAIAHTGSGTRLERLLPWFALVPFLWSLHRQRHRCAARWGHGLTFGLVLATLTLSSSLRAYRIELAGDRATGIVDLLRTGGHAVVVWGTLLLFSGIFAATAGPILRARSRVLPVLSLPLLWSGLEFLRTQFLGASFAWIPLGTTVLPESPEAQIAAKFGLAGLGAIIVLVNVLFALAPHAGNWRRQVTACVLASGILVALHVNGLAELRPESTLEDRLRIGLVQVESNDLETPFSIARNVLDAGPDLIVLPPDAFLERRERREILEARIGAFARRERVDVLAGVGLLDHTALTDPNTLPTEHETTDEEADELSIPRPRPVRSALLFFSSRGRVATVVAEAARSERGPRVWAAPGGSVLHTPLATIGVCVASELDRALTARSFSRRGAQLLVVAALDERAAGPVHARMHARLEAYRAVETRTWLLRTTPGGNSAYVNAHGRSVSEAPSGLDWASVEAVTLRSTDDPPSHFVRWGWCFGPISLGCAVGLIFAALLRPLSLARQTAGATNDARRPGHDAMPLDGGDPDDGTPDLPTDPRILGEPPADPGD